HDITAKVLIDAGSDIEAKNSHEETALDLAVANGKLETVKMLLQNGAVIEHPNDDR
ncbi:ankyrin repeat protein, partial [Oesophagostomum dentatum]